MPSSVKLRTVACLTSLLAAAAVMAAPPRDAKVMLSKNSSLPSGTVIREIREIRAENGTRTITEGGKVMARDGARYVHRVNLVKHLGGNDRDQVSVRDSARECLFYLGTVAPASTEGATPLQALDLRMRRVSGRWSHELDKGTPTDLQRAALVEFSQIADLVGVLGLCTSPQPRAKGESWKVDEHRPAGRAYGYVVAEKIECRLEDVSEVEGVPHARIAVTGELKVERPLNINGAMKVTFTGTVTRRLSDMLDVETTLTGDFSYSGPVIAQGKPAEARIDLPWKLTRTQKIEAK